MNKTLYKIIGWFLIVGSLISIVLTFYFNWCWNCDIIDLLNEFFGAIILSILIFIFGFIPGKFYIKIGTKLKENKLTNSSLTLTLISLIIALVEYALIAVSCFISVSCEITGTAILALLALFIPSLLYGISIILLIINWFKNRN